MAIDARVSDGAKVTGIERTEPAFDILSLIGDKPVTGRLSAGKNDLGDRLEETGILPHVDILACAGGEPVKFNPAIITKNKPGDNPFTDGTNLSPEQKADVNRNFKELKSDVQKKTNEELSRSYSTLMEKLFPDKDSITLAPLEGYPPMKIQFKHLPQGADLLKKEADGEGTIITVRVELPDKQVARIPLMYIRSAMAVEVNEPNNQQRGTRAKPDVSRGCDVLKPDV